MKWIDRIAAECTPERMADRAWWYDLRIAFDTLRTQGGDGIAFGASAELLERMKVFVDDDDREHFYSETWNILEGVYADGICDSDNTIIEKGRYAGHPVWHVLNPWFRLWHAAKADTSRVGAIWANDPAITKPRDQAYVDGLYASFLNDPNPGRDMLAKLVREIGPDATVLDYGCGYGNWLTWLVDKCGVKPDNVLGVDALLARVEAARLMGARAGIPSYAFGPPSFLISPVPFFAPKNFDIIVLAAVTGCLQDAELDATLAELAKLKPRYFFETHSIDSAPTWIGRPNSDAFFARIGYKPLRSEMLGDPLTRERLHELVCPAKYYLAMRCAIYERSA